MATLADKGNVRVGITGWVYRAPIGTALPTSVTETLNAAFESVGYVSEDGITLNTETGTVEIKAAQWSQVVRTLQNEHKVTAAFTMIETTDLTQKIFWADEDATTDHVRVTAAQSVPHSWVIEIIDGDDVMLFVAEDGSPTERGEVQLLDDEQAHAYPVTIQFMGDATGKKADIYRGKRTVTPGD